MSTTPMQRPFLVGQSLAGQSPVDSGLVDQDPAANDRANHNLAGCGPRRRGLHLVPQPLKRQVMLAGQVGNIYKLVVAAAAAFLILTMI